MEDMEYLKGELQKLCDELSRPLQEIVAVGDELSSKVKSLTRNDLADAYLKVDLIARLALGLTKPRTEAEVEQEIEAARRELESADKVGG